MGDDNAPAERRTAEAWAAAKRTARHWFEGARVGNAWPVGKELSELEFDAAIAAVQSMEVR